MKQMTLASGGFERYGKTTRRAALLAGMDRVVPWVELCALVELHYPADEAVQEGQPVVLRHEGPRGGGRKDQADPPGRRHVRGAA